MRLCQKAQSPATPPNQYRTPSGKSGHKTQAATWDSPAATGRPPDSSAHLGKGAIIWSAVASPAGTTTPLSLGPWQDVAHRRDRKRRRRPGAPGLCRRTPYGPATCDSPASAGRPRGISAHSETGIKGEGIKGVRNLFHGIPFSFSVGRGAEVRLQAEPCHHARHPCGLGNMNSPRLGGDGRLGRARPDIPDLVAACTMLILYASQPGPSTQSQAQARPSHATIRAGIPSRHPKPSRAGGGRDGIRNLPSECPDYPGLRPRVGGLTCGGNAPLAGRWVLECRASASRRAAFLLRGAGRVSRRCLFSARPRLPRPPRRRQGPG
jgi:hypothetical protein